MDDIVGALDLPALRAKTRRGYRTLGGLIMARLGHIARPGDEITEGSFSFHVQSLDGRRVARIRIVRSV